MVWLLFLKFGYFLFNVPLATLLIILHLNSTILDAAAAAETLVNFFTKLENNSKWRQVNGKFRMLIYFLILLSPPIYF